MVPGVRLVKGKNPLPPSNGHTFNDSVFAGGGGVVKPEPLKQKGHIH